MPVIHEGYSEDIFKITKNPSIIQAAIYEDESQHLLLSYMRLLMLSTEYRLSDLIANFDNFKSVFEIKSNLIQVFLEQSHFETTSTKDLHTLRWNPDNPMITFGSITSLLSAEQIAE